MNLEALTRRMAAFPDVLAAVLQPLSADELTWRPAGGGWSIAEIVGHLLVEETEDFRQRLFLTLQHPGTPWPPIDPEQRVCDENFQNADVADLLHQFRSAREQSVQQLHQMVSPDWNAQYDHPKLGTFHAGDLMAAWATHDTLHLRQITKRLYQITGRDTQPWKTEYAGEWKA